MIIIDAIGDVCPIPVIKTKKALKEANQVQITVDNEIATQNLKKMADQLKFSFQMNQKGKSEFEVIIIQNTDERDTALVVQKEEFPSKSNQDYIVVVDTEVMGRGDDKLGRTLLKGFFYALSEQDILPKRVILYNGGVHAGVKESTSLEDLLALEEKGTEVYLCGACTDYYGLTDKVGVGEITNMYRIVEMMREASKIVKP